MWAGTPWHEHGMSHGCQIYRWHVPRMSSARSISVVGKACPSGVDAESRETTVGRSGPSIESGDSRTARSTRHGRMVIPIQRVHARSGAPVRRWGSCPAVSAGTQSLNGNAEPGQPRNGSVIRVMVTYRRPGCPGVSEGSLGVERVGRTSVKTADAPAPAAAPPDTTGTVSKAYLNKGPPKSKKCAVAGRDFTIPVPADQTLPLLRGAIPMVFQHPWGARF